MESPTNSLPQKAQHPQSPTHSQGSNPPKPEPSLRSLHPSKRPHLMPRLPQNGHTPLRPHAPLRPHPTHLQLRPSPGDVPNGVGTQGVGHLPHPRGLHIRQRLGPCCLYLCPGPLRLHLLRLHPLQPLQLRLLGVENA